MALSGRIPAGLDTNKLVPEIFSKDVILAVKSKLVALPFVNHSYEKDLVKGDTLYIPRSQHATATEVTVGTEGVQNDPFTTAITVTINKWYEAPYTVDYMSRHQSQVNLTSTAKEESAYAIAKIMDYDVCYLFAALSDSTGHGTDGSAITDDVLIDAVEELDSADVPEDGRAWILDPSAKADIMCIDKFVRSDYFASDVVPTGGFRKDIYGAPLLITNNLRVNSTGNYGAYLHRDALAAVVQMNPTVDVVEQPLKHQLVINTTVLYGVAEIQDDFGCPILTRSA